MNTMYQKIKPKERLCITKIFQRLEREKRFVQDVKKERENNKMELLTITKLNGENISPYKQWLTKPLLNKVYDNPVNLLKRFRKIVPKGRFAFGVTISGIRAYVIDTRIIEKKGNNIFSGQEVKV